MSSRGSPQFIGSFSSLVTTWLHRINTLKANGLIDEAIIHTVTFIGMQDVEIQDTLAKHKKRLETVLRRARKIQGVDGVQSQYGQTQFIQTEGYRALDEVLPQISIILHEYDYFTPISGYDVDSKKPEPI